MKEHQVHKVNDGPGLMIEGNERERLKWLRCSPESGLVEFWVCVDRRPGIDEVLQYLTPSEAMKLGVALQNCAFEALKQEADGA